MAETPCPHCGELHDATLAYCPKTGDVISAGDAGFGAAPAATSSAAADAPAHPDKGVADILGEAWTLYRKHARALLLTCAVLFVPASIAKSCAVSVIMAPAYAATVHDGAVAAQAADLEASRAALQDAYQRHADAATVARLQADQARLLTEMGRRSMLAASAAMGSFTAFVLGILGTLVTFFIFAATQGVTHGALTIAVADRITGGSAGWREVWMLMFRRLGPLLMAVIPAAFLTAFGFALFVVPGIILALLFAFISPVVLIEGLRGGAAIRRSVELVSADWLRVAIMIIVLAVLGWVARVVASFLVPHAAIFVGSLVSDLVTLVFLPIPVLGMVLLYFDIRRKRDNFTDDRLRADLEALKTT